MSLQLCSDTSEAVELCERYNLFLKPHWKIKVCVQLPVLKIPGQSISSWEVMEKLKKMVIPDEFTTLKVSKSNLILIQFEAEVEKKMTMTRVLQKLQSNTMKLSGFADVLKIRAAPAKLNFPTRHDWDSFFRDAKNLREILPGERPDTIYFQNLPSKWFVDKTTDSDKPSEYVLKKVFETFGEIRKLEIPSLHKSNVENETFKKISMFSQDLVFDAYVQYKEYIGFVKSMDSLKGMKLMFVGDGGKAYSACIKVDFDKTRYLSDNSIKQRLIEREKLEVKTVSESKPKIKESCVETAKPSHSSHKKVKIDKKTISKAKQLRQKESSVLLKELLRRAEAVELGKQAEIEQQIAQERLRQQKLLERTTEQKKKREKEKERQQRKYLLNQERLLKTKLLRDLKQREEQRTEKLREKLRKELAGRHKLKSVLVPACKQ